MTPVQGPDREERLNHMVLAYEKDLLRLCAVYLRDIDFAQDAVQETFIKAYRRMNCFEGRASEKTWRMRIAINTWNAICQGKNLSDLTNLLHINISQTKNRQNENSPPLYS